MRRRRVGFPVPACVAATPAGAQLTARIVEGDCRSIRLDVATLIRVDS